MDSLYAEVSAACPNGVERCECLNAPGTFTEGPFDPRDGLYKNRSSRKTGVGSKGEKNHLKIRLRIRLRISLRFPILEKVQK